MLKIHWLDLIENKIKIWVKTVSGLRSSSKLRLVCTYPDYRNIPINELDLERCLDNFYFLKYEFDFDDHKIDKCKIELRFLDNIVSSEELPIQDVRRCREMLDEYLPIWNQIKISLKNCEMLIKDNWKKIGRKL